MTGGTFVPQGGFAVTRDPEAVLWTLLGAGVATCIWDSEAGVGGMNHLLLPTAREGSRALNRNGLHAMEMLVNALLREGADRSRLRAKLFGGGRLTPVPWDLGDGNATFAETYLSAEGIDCTALSLRGARARRVVFRAATGQARMLFVPDAEIEAEPPLAIPIQGPAPDVTLF